MNINIIGPIVDTTSYGIVGINLITALARLGHDVRVKTLHQPHVHPNNINYNIVGECLQKQLDNSAPTIIVWHHFDLKKFRLPQLTGPVIAFPIFECNRFHEEEISQMNAMDAIFTTCDWYKKILDKNISKPTHIVNLGVDPDVFKKESSNSEHEVRFLNIGKWEIRKGHDFLARCFKEAFQRTDEYTLGLCCDNPFLSANENLAWENYYKNMLGEEHVEIIKRVDTQQELAAIMNRYDVGVFPSRAEGWNLELAEMLALGKNCIATKFAAHTEYCTWKNCELIVMPDEPWETAYDGKWFFGNFEWAKLDKNCETQVIRYLRRCKQDKELGQLNSNQAAIEDMKRFTWESSAKQILNYLEKINA